MVRGICFSWSMEDVNKYVVLIYIMNELQQLHEIHENYNVQILNTHPEISLLAKSSLSSFVNTVISSGILQYQEIFAPQ